MQVASSALVNTAAATNVSDKKNVGSGNLESRGRGYTALK